MRHNRMRYPYRDSMPLILRSLSVTCARHDDHVPHQAEPRCNLHMRKHSIDCIP
jgi:hypothetical protein